jgi:hypothetical protein
VVDELVWFSRRKTFSINYLAFQSTTEENVMWKLRSLLLFLVTLFVVSSAAAAPIRFYANMTGGQEQPAVKTSAYGRAGFEFANSLTSISYIINTGNMGTPTAAHIHCAPAGQNGPVGVTLQLRSATGHGTITKPDKNNACGWVTVADVMTAMQSGNAYINVHTVAFPTGEIRGQIR